MFIIEILDMLNEIDSLIFRINNLIDKFKELRSENINLSDQVKKYNLEISNIKEINDKKDLDIKHWKDKSIELEKNVIEQAKIYDFEISIFKEEFEKHNSEIAYWKNKSHDSEDKAFSLISEKDSIEIILNNKLIAQEENYKEKEKLMKNYENELKDVLLSQESKISRMRDNMKLAIKRLRELANKLPGIFSVEDDINGTS
ncbi:hypothetical protein CONE_0003 [Candidatus Kinetoplastibacterium oncopeltii TCC290E]|uniref:Uncharacterized protein n=2 Tax=Candidatus Kinetoplastidibacterium stringomonadis TaxID=994696 RepID=M1LZN0_9PROT|nr:hypothetical protein CONE_0003 [Candidatus Kinetoplastibacterium oncopeltii TCC290E]